METAVTFVSLHLIPSVCVAAHMEWSWPPISRHALMILPMSPLRCSAAPTPSPALTEDVFLRAISVTVWMTVMTTVMRPTVELTVRYIYSLYYNFSVKTEFRRYLLTPTQRYINNLWEFKTCPQRKAFIFAIVNCAFLTGFYHYSSRLYCCMYYNRFWVSLHMFREEFGFLEPYLEIFDWSMWNHLMWGSKG